MSGAATRSGEAPTAATAWSRPLVAWVVAWSLVATLLAVAIALGPLAGIAHVQDEVVYDWQAEQLAGGRLFAPVPEPRAAHVYDFLLDTPRGRVGIFPLGWPLVLALGHLAGAPWFVNPLLEGLIVLLGSVLAMRLAGGGAVRIAAPWLALSPQALLLGASRMAHPLAAALALASLLLALGRERPGRGAGLALGGVLGALALARPLDAVVVAAVAVPLALWRRRARGYAAGIAAGLALGALAVGAQNWALSGTPWRFAQSLYYETAAPPAPGEGYRFAPGCNALGFGADRGCFATWGSFGHTPAKAARDIELNAGLASHLWLGTPWAWTLVAAAFVLRRARRAAGLAAAVGLSLVVAYALYWYGGACFGARFWHAALPLVVIAAAAATAVLLERFGRRPWPALLLLIPMASCLARSLPELGEYWGVDDRFVRLESEWQGRPALVLIAYRSELRLTHPRATTGQDLLVAPWRWRAAWLPQHGAVAFAEYQPALVDVLARRAPGKELWLYEMAADPQEDVLRPFVVEDRGETQVDDLPLPAELPLRPAPRHAGDLWSDSFRVVEVGQRR